MISYALMEEIVTIKAVAAPARRQRLPARLPQAGRG